MIQLCTKRLKCQVDLPIATCLGHKYKKEGRLLKTDEAALTAGLCTPKTSVLKLSSE